MIAAERRRKMGMRRKKVEEEVKTMFVSCNLFLAKASVSETAGGKEHFKVRSCVFHDCCFNKKRDFIRLRKITWMWTRTY